MWIRKIFFFLVVLPITAIAIPHLSSWQSITLGKYAAYSNIVSGSESNTAYVVLNDTNAPNSPTAALYKINLTTEVASQIGPKFSISNDTAKTSLALDKTDTPYVAYTSNDAHNINIIKLSSPTNNSWENLGGKQYTEPDFSIDDFKILVSLITDKAYVLYKASSELRVITATKDNNLWQSESYFNYVYNRPLKNIDAVINSDINGDVVIFADQTSTDINTRNTPEIFMLKNGLWSNYSCINDSNATGECATNTMIDQISLGIDANNKPMVSFTSSDRDSSGNPQIALGMIIPHLKCDKDYCWQIFTMSANGILSPHFFAYDSNNYIQGFISQDIDGFHYVTRIYNSSQDEWSEFQQEPDIINANYDKNYGHIYYDNRSAYKDRLFVMVSDQNNNLILGAQKVLP